MFCFCWSDMNWIDEAAADRQTFGSNAYTWRKLKSQLISFQPHLSSEWKREANRVEYPPLYWLLIISISCSKYFLIIFQKETTSLIFFNSHFRGNVGGLTWAKIFGGGRANGVSTANNNLVLLLSFAFVPCPLSLVPGPSSLVLFPLAKCPKWFRYLAMSAAPALQMLVGFYV